MDLERLPSLLTLLRQHGVTRYETADVKLELRPIVAEEPTAPLPTESVEDLLYLHERVGV